MHDKDGQEELENINHEKMERHDPKA